MVPNLADDVLNSLLEDDEIGELVASRRLRTSYVPRTADGVVRTRTADGITRTGTADGNMHSWTADGNLRSGTVDGITRSSPFRRTLDNTHEGNLYR